MSNDKTHSRWAVMATVLFYMFAAILMIIANKWVLLKTDTPLFFLLAQLLIAVFMFVVVSLSGLFKITLKLDWATCKGLWPMIAVNVLGLSANNYCLKYVDASFYQIARGLILPLTVLLSLLFLRSSRPSVKVLLACAIVTAGFFVGVILDGGYTAPALPSTTSTDAESNTPLDSKPKISLLGIGFGLLSSLTTATHAVIIKRSLSLVNNDAIELAWYSNILSSIVLIPVILLVGEGPSVITLLQTPFYVDGEMSVLSRFLWGSLVTGLVGWMLSIAGVLSIKITSPITHMVSSAVRGILQSAMGVWAFGEIITTGRASSIAIIIAGSAWYTWAKNEELMEQRKLEAGSNKVEMQMQQRVEEERERLVFDAGEERDDDLERGFNYSQRTGDLGVNTRSKGRGYAGPTLEETGTPDIRVDNEKQHPRP